MPEALPTKTQADDLTRAFEIYQTRRIFEHDVCLQKTASAVREMQELLDEQMRPSAQKRIEDEIRTQREMP